MRLNLLDTRMADNKVVAGEIVVEPDFLVDISSLAACFEDFGHHPLLYTLNRLKNALTHITSYSVTLRAWCSTM